MTKKQQPQPCRAQNLRMATYKSAGSILHARPQLSPEQLSTKSDALRGMSPHRERRAVPPSSGHLQPLLLRTLTFFISAEPS